MVVKVNVGKEVYYTDMDKAKDIIKKYKKDKVEVKETLGAEVLIVVGGVVLGTFAMDIARRIASELK